MMMMKMMMMMFHSSSSYPTSSCVRYTSSFLWLLLLFGCTLTMMIDSSLAFVVVTPTTTTRPTISSTSASLLSMTSSGTVEITPKNIKALRDMTGAGMMDCKKALMDANGQMDMAMESLRMKGLAKADKKASRIAAEGRMVVATNDNTAILVEINCETDFVAKDTSFQSFCQTVANTALSLPPSAAHEDEKSVATLMALPVSHSSNNDDDGTTTTATTTLEELRQALVAKIGENIQVRRYATMTRPSSQNINAAADDDDGMSSIIGAYVHMNRIGVLVEIQNCHDITAASDVAMHVAAMNPPYATASQVPPEVIEKERQFFIEQASSSGKPPAIIEKMVTGRIRKYLEEICCDSQPFVKNPDLTVKQMLQQKNKNANIVRLIRLEVGEGLAKKDDDFAAEVAAMAGAK
jgi:elongation factor Ts